MLPHRPKVSVAVLAISTFMTTLTLDAANNAKDRLVGDLMAAAGIPGMEAAVVSPSRIEWEKSFGDAVLDVPGPGRAYYGTGEEADGLDIALLLLPMGIAVICVAGGCALTRISYRHWSPGHRDHDGD